MVKDLVEKFNTIIGEKMDFSISTDLFSYDFAKVIESVEIGNTELSIVISFDDESNLFINTDEDTIIVLDGSDEDFDDAIVVVTTENTNIVVYDSI